MTMDQEIWKTLPWLANGRLDNGGHNDLHREIERHEPLRRGLAWEQLLREAVRQESETHVAPPRVLSEVLARIGKDARPTRALPRNEGSWFAQLFSAWKWSPQLALACSLVVVQFGVIGYLSSAQQEPESPVEYRNVAVAPTAATQFLRINFHDEVTEIGMRELLYGVGAEIVAGPYQLGDYYLYVDQDAVDRVAQALQSDQRVVYVEKVDDLPARP